MKFRSSNINCCFWLRPTHTQAFRQAKSTVFRAVSVVTLRANIWSVDFIKSIAYVNELNLFESKIKSWCNKFIDQFIIIFKTAKNNLFTLLIMMIQFKWLLFTFFSSLMSPFSDLNIFIQIHSALSLIWTKKCKIQCNAESAMISIQQSKITHFKRQSSSVLTLRTSSSGIVWHREIAGSCTIFKSE